jgi:hypothetical protein
MDLLPFQALMEVSKVFEEGAKKYRANNWRRGIPLSRYADSGPRHFAKWMAGMRDENHLEMAAWNFLCLIETQLLIKQGLLPEALNDLPYNPLDIEDNPFDIPDLALGDEGAENDDIDKSAAVMREDKAREYNEQYKKIAPGDAFIVSNSSGFAEVVKHDPVPEETVEEQCRDWVPKEAVECCDDCEGACDPECLCVVDRVVAEHMEDVDTSREEFFASYFGETYRPEEGLESK